MPRTVRPGAAQCRAKPPTPQYRSHSEAGETSSTHSRACRYSAAATSVFVWKKLCGRRCSVIPSSRIGRVSRSVRTISRSPSSTAACAGWTFTLTTATWGRASSSQGRCLRIRATGSWERRTSRTMSSPSGERVASTCLSSPRRAASRGVSRRRRRPAPPSGPSGERSYGRMPARVTSSASTGNAAWSAGGYRPQSVRSMPRPASGPPAAPTMPSTGSSTVPVTTIFALLRKPASGLVTAGSHATSSYAARSPRTCSTFCCTCVGYATARRVHEPQRPASKWRHCTPPSSQPGSAHPVQGPGPTKMQKGWPSGSA